MKPTYLHFLHKPWQFWRVHSGCCPYHCSATLIWILALLAFCFYISFSSFTKLVTVIQRWRGITYAIDIQFIILISVCSWELPSSSTLGYFNIGSLSATFLQCLVVWIQASVSVCVCQENSFIQTRSKENTLHAGPRSIQLSLPIKESDFKFPTYWIKCFLFSYHHSSTLVG